MKFIVHEKSRINNVLDVSVLGTFNSVTQAFDTIRAKRNQMSEMFGVDKDSVYNNESLKPFHFMGENGEKVSWWIDKQQD